VIREEGALKVAVASDFLLSFEGSALEEAQIVGAFFASLSSRRPRFTLSEFVLSTT
jgi:hypothetical protein